MKDLLFMLADVWMIFAGFYYGWRFIRRHHNYLLGLEWMVVATSGSNFLVWALGGVIREIPIIFVDRRSGVSKMSGNIISEAATMVWKLRAAKVTGRLRRRYSSPVRLKAAK